MKTDIVNLIKVFDSFLDDMYDRGAFDPTNKEDMEIETLVRDMKKKYLNH